MKRVFCFVLTMAVLVKWAYSQDFTGYRSGNYNGVNSVFFNPANIADSKYRFDVNLFSISSNVSNDRSSFSLGNLTNSFNKDSLINSVFGENGGTSNGFISTDIHGPSVMFNAGKNTTIALTTRGRVMSNVTNIEGKLAEKILNDFISDPTLPFTFHNNSSMLVNTNAWTEYGVSLARVISNQGPHFLKAGVTLKYLAGAGNGYMNIGGFKGTINQDNFQNDFYLNNTTGSIALGFGGVNMSDFNASKLTKMESRGFGGDIGLVYEFRPDYYDGGNGLSKSNNNYKLKVGVSLLDIGSIKYQKDMQRSGAYNIGITGNEKFYLSDLEGKGISDYKSFFENQKQYFTENNSNKETNYSVSLPTTLHVDIDYHLQNNFYIALGSQLSMVSSENKPYNSKYYNSVVLTPRYEGKVFGFYLPISYNALTKMNAGISLRVGPVFIGSGSLITAAFGDSKQADVHVGLRFGGLQ